MKKTIFVAQPLYSRTVHYGAAEAFLKASKTCRMVNKTDGSSLLARNFNLLFCHALEWRDRGQADYFAMIHGDVVPPVWWADVMIAEMERVGADVLSAVVPLKSEHGLTSTAIDRVALTDLELAGDLAGDGGGYEVEDCTHFWAVERRLTMTEVMGLPITFGAADVCPGHALLVNTGLFVCNLHRNWYDNDDFCFTIRDRIVRERQDGRVVKRTVQCVPEDWHFSREVQRHGGKVMATRIVPLFHDHERYNNHSAWGEWSWDKEFADSPLRVST